MKLARIVTITLGIAGILVIIVGGLFAYTMSRPLPPKPNISIFFAGYTNDATGRLAIFTITNANAASVQRQSRYCIQIPAGSRWVNVSGAWLAGSVIEAIASETLSVPAPTNATWRIQITAHSNTGLLADVFDSVAEAARAAGIRLRRHKVAYAFQSQWIGQ